MTSDNCPHCNHVWTGHDIRWMGGHTRCHCGCLWNPPEPPKLEPTAHELLVARVRGAIYAELNAQHEADAIGGAGYWDDDWGRLDGEPDWNRVAEAAIAAVRRPGHPE